MSLADNSIVMSELLVEGGEVYYKNITLVLQSMVFEGVHVVCIPFLVHILLKPGQKLRPNMYMVFSMILPFIISAAFWVAQFVGQMTRIDNYFRDPAKRPAHVTPYSTMFNAIVYLNFLISDAIVVWRAWVLCKDDYRKALYIPMFFLTLTTLCVFAVVGVRFASFLTPAGPSASHATPLIHALDIFQVSAVAWSLITNITATSVITHKAWRHRQIIKAGLQNAPNRSTKAERVLVLLIESGFLYCISGITVLVAMMIRLPNGTLGDIYIPINVTIAGIYPTVVIVLVGLQRTMDKTTYFQSIETPNINITTNPRDHRSVVVGSMQFTRDSRLGHTSIVVSEIQFTSGDVAVYKGGVGGDQDRVAKSRASFELGGSSPAHSSRISEMGYDP